MDPKHAPGLLKKWLSMMRTAYPEAETLHRMLRTELDPKVIEKILAASQISASTLEVIREQSDLELT